ncbi:hypothetical protein D3C86_1031820 [compost metagenome]
MEFPTILPTAGFIVIVLPLAAVKSTEYVNKSKEQTLVITFKNGESFISKVTGVLEILEHEPILF